MGDVGHAVLIAGLVVAFWAALFSALVLVGAVIAIVRDDHRNPVVRPGLERYERRFRHG